MIFGVPCCSEVQSLQTPPLHRLALIRRHDATLVRRAQQLAPLSSPYTAPVYRTWCSEFDITVTDLHSVGPCFQSRPGKLATLPEVFSIEFLSLLQTDTGVVLPISQHHVQIPHTLHQPLRHPTLHGRTRHENVPKQSEFRAES
jgi:hypothetical protein